MLGTKVSINVGVLDVARRRQLTGAPGMMDERSLLSYNWYHQPGILCSVENFRLHYRVTDTIPATRLFCLFCLVCLVFPVWL